MAYLDDVRTVQDTDRMARLLRKTQVERLVDEPQGLSNGVPRTFFVNSASTNAASTNNGLEPLYPFATLAQAVAAAVDGRGDIIYVAAGHTETTTVQITIAKAGLSIIGLGVRRHRPTITFNHTTDGISVAAANVSISGFIFPTPSAAVTSFIDLAGADAEINDCEFACGANATNGTITIPAAGLRPRITNCVWRITANGPVMAISIESATVDGCHFENLRSYGGSLTNAWDTAFISSTAAHTGFYANNIVNDFGPTITFTGAATGTMKDIWPGDVSAGASQLNPGNCTVLGGPVEGYLTRRATADILTAGTVNAFTVTGRVIMTRIIWEVTTVVGAGADTIALLHSPTGGDAVTIGAASASIATKAVGDTFGLVVNPGAATYSLAVNVSGVAPIQTLGIVLKAGILAHVSTNNTTGSMKIDLWWKPIDVGSAVVVI